MTVYLLLWWWSHAPRHAVLDCDQEKAEDLARERNAVLVPISGDDVIVGRIRDFYRRYKGDGLVSVERDLGKEPYRTDKAWQSLSELP